MSWSKIKKAINSTLGTSDFKPLDKIVKEAFEEIKTKFSNLTNLLTNGENEFIVQRAKEADLADKASQTAIPVELFDGSRSSVNDVVVELKVGIYIITHCVLASEDDFETGKRAFKNWDNDLIYINDDIVSPRLPDDTLDSSINSYYGNYVTSVSGNHYAINVNTKKLFIPTDSTRRLMNLAFIATNETK